MSRFSLVLLAILVGCDRAMPIESDLLRSLERRYAAAVRNWLESGRAPRADGYFKTVEIGQLLSWAAAAGDRGLYDAMHALAVRTVRDDPGDADTRGFVAWRYRPDTPFDASGTTEALRIAEGLWRGAAAFGRPADRDLARTILAGYARHAGVDQGVWMIRNYYNFGTGAFATNSYLIDYDPDFLTEVADATGDETLRDVAARSLTLARAAIAPCRLFYDLVQPEVLTLMPEASVVAFSPNDTIQLSNALAVAERVVRTAPAVARDCLEFARRRASRLRAYYTGRTGEPRGTDRPGLSGWAAAARLAARLGDDEAMHTFLRRLLPEAIAYLENPAQPRLWVASEVLWTLRLARNRVANTDRRANQRMP